MNRFVSLLAATSVLAFTVGSAQANQTGTFMDGLPFVYEGRIGGLDAWSLEGSTELWMVLPDGQHVIGGYVFNRRGFDVGSVTLGIEPVNIWESLSIENPSGANEDVRPAEPPVYRTLPIMGEPAIPQASGIPAEGRDAAVSEAMRDTAPLLSRVSDAERRELLEDLVRAIAEAETPEGFQRALIHWRERVTGEVLLPVGEIEESTGSVTTINESPAVAALVERALQQAANPQPDPIAGEPVSTAAPALATSDVEFFEDIRENTFWFSVGSAEAPTVYMVYDPTCPHCARSIRNLEPRIQAGQLQLRVILAPLISDESLGLTAAILASPTPVATFMENALQRARFGSSDLEAMDPAVLRVELLSGIQGNIDFMQRYEVPGVPFFGWMGPNGPQFLAGVPARDYAFNAQVDDFSGRE